MKMEYKLTTTTELFLADVDVEIYFEAVEEDGEPVIRDIQQVLLIGEDEETTNIYSVVSGSEVLRDALTEKLIDEVNEWEIV